jgi:hypothetical protein
MGNNLVVSYDLHKPEKNYQAIISEIKTLGAWAHVHGSVWYVKSALNAEQARDRLVKKLDANDSLIVVDATNNQAAWYNLDPTVAQFIRDHWALRQAA